MPRSETQLRQPMFIQMVSDTYRKKFYTKIPPVYIEGRLEKIAGIIETARKKIPQWKVRELVLAENAKKLKEAEENLGQKKNKETGEIEGEDLEFMIRPYIKANPAFAMTFERKDKEKIHALFYPQSYEAVLEDPIEKMDIGTDTPRRRANMITVYFLGLGKNEEGVPDLLMESIRPALKEKSKRKKKAEKAGEGKPLPRTQY